MSVTLPESRLVDFEAALGSTSWERALEDDVDHVDATDSPGEYVVSFSTSEEAHTARLVEDQGDYLGWCSCRGFKHHDGPCVHLCRLRQMATLNESMIPSLEDVDVDLEDEDDDTWDDSAWDQDDDDDQDPDPPAVATTTSGPSGVPDVATSEEFPHDERVDDLVDTDDPWGESFGDVPERFVVDMHGEPEIRRAGYAALAQAAGLAVDLEAEVVADASGFEYARYRATVLRDGQPVASDVGSAHVDREDLAKAEYKLDDLAATRALMRALEWATGAGRTAVQEGSA